MPVLGSTSGELLADTTGNVQVGKNANTTIFMKIKDFYFVYIVNYLDPGTSYERWVKAYGCSV